MWGTLQKNQVKNCEPNRNRHRIRCVLAQRETSFGGCNKKPSKILRNTATPSTRPIVPARGGRAARSPRLGRGSQHVDPGRPAGPNAANQHGDPCRICGGSLAFFSAWASDSGGYAALATCMGCLYDGIVGPCNSEQKATELVEHGIAPALMHAVDGNSVVLTADRGRFGNICEILWEHNFISRAMTDQKQRN